jgi:hypothetical protein
VYRRALQPEDNNDDARDLVKQGHLRQKNLPKPRG